MPKARLQLGGRQSPEAELPTCCCPSWGASSSSRGRPLGLGSEAGGGGSPARQVLPAGRAGAAGVASSPPRGGSRGWTRGQARCDWPAAAGGGARPPVSRGPPQKSPGYCRAHWIPGQRAACPAPPASWLLGIRVCFGALALTNHWILHASVPPYVHSMSPCSCASNR